MRVARRAAALDRDGLRGDLPVSRDASLSRFRTSASRGDVRRSPRRSPARRCSSTAACCRSACARSSACRARSTSASAIRSISTRVALRYPQVPIIIPHFGAGLLREALMVADLCPNMLLRHVELERLDQVPARPDAQPPSSARPSPSSGPIGCCSDRLVVLSARMGEGRLRAAVGGAGRDRCERGGDARRSSVETSIGCFPDGDRRRHKATTNNTRTVHRASCSRGPVRVSWLSARTTCRCSRSRSRPKSPLKSRHTEWMWLPSFWVLSYSIEERRALDRGSSASCRARSRRPTRSRSSRRPPSSAAPGDRRRCRPPS